MPEGDTIHRTARTLHHALVGQRVDAYRGPGLEAAVVGRRVEAVRARGKHLIIAFAGGYRLHSHMRMEGSWHVYRPGERWRKSARGARATLVTRAWVAVCFYAPLVELLAPQQRSDLLDGLGPDLLDPALDLEAAVAALVTAGHLPLGVALMDQRLVAGIGNVYKSEVLFETAENPFAPVSAFDRARLRAVLARAATLMRKNLRAGPRSTRRRLGPGRLWVYGRKDEPCYRCGSRIDMRRQGPQARSTYFCAACQGLSSASSEAPPSASSASVSSASESDPAATVSPPRPPTWTETPQS